MGTICEAFRQERAGEVLSRGYGVTPNMNGSRRANAAMRIDQRITMRVLASIVGSHTRRRLPHDRTMRRAHRPRPKMVT